MGFMLMYCQVFLYWGILIAILFLVILITKWWCNKDMFPPNCNTWTNLWRVKWFWINCLMILIIKIGQNGAKKSVLSLILLLYWTRHGGKKNEKFYVSNNTPLEEFYLLLQLHSTWGLYFQLVTHKKGRISRSLF